MAEEGEAGPRRDSVGVSQGESAAMQEDGKSSTEDFISREEVSNFEHHGARGVPQDSVSQNPPLRESEDVENTPMLTPEKPTSRVPRNEAKNFLDHESTPDDGVNRQESIECRSFLESDDFSESAPTDNASEMSTSVKNYSTVDDEGATPQESEDVVMEIAERLSQLRSIAKTAESARKYILESDVDTSMEEVDSNDHMSDMLGPKRLDFEVIDFDQFGAQPPDLPLNNSLTKGNHHGGRGARAKKPEHHHVRALDARYGFEQEMKGLNDSPVKISLKNTPEKKQPRRERGVGALDLPTGHVIPRLCNMVNVKEGSRGHDISRDADTNSIAGRSGNSKLRLLDSVKPKKIGEALPGSPIRRSKSTMPDVKGSSLVHEEARKRAEDLHHVTHMQAKRLEEYCNRVDLSTAQLEDQFRELSRKLETECGERLKSDAKLMMLCELLPSVEEKMKNLCDQMLFMEVQLQEQVDSRRKLEEASERERQERIHIVAELEEQVDLRNKLEDELEQERRERMHLAARLDEQVDFSNKLQGDLERECEERMHLAAKLGQQVDLRSKLEEDVEQERQERMRFVAKLEQQVALRNKLEEDLDQERQERMHLAAKLEQQVALRDKLEKDVEQERQERMRFVAKLEQQVALRNKLEEDLDQECQERMHLAAKLEQQVSLRNKLEEDVEQERQARRQLAAKLDEQVDFSKKLEENLAQEREARTQYVSQLEEHIMLREELAYKLEEERDERLTSEAGVTVLREMLPGVEEKLEDLNNQVESLAGQLQEQTGLTEELKEKLDQVQQMAILEEQTKMREELAHSFEQRRHERHDYESNLKKLKELQHQVLSLTSQLQEQVKLRKKLEERLDREREDRISSAVAMAHHTSERLPVSEEEKLEFTKLLNEQKALLTNQVNEAELLKTATEKKVGLLNHQVQNLEMLSEVVETMECVFSAKERAVRQAMWTVFQAVCLGMGLINFIVSCRNPLQSSLQPT